METPGQATEPQAVQQTLTQVPVKLLDRKHPEYDLYQQLWADIDILNEAGVRLQQAADRFLRRPGKQLPDIFEERLQTVTATPLLGTISGWYASSLFRRNPTIDAKGYEDFLNNCDCSGTQFIDFLRDIFDHLFLYGRAWVLIELPKPDPQTASLADELDQKLDSPYLVLHHPSEIINWAFDDVGELNWVLIKQLKQSNTFLGPEELQYVWTLFDRTGYRKYSAKVEKNAATEIQMTFPKIGDPPLMADLIEEGPHALSPYNMVPFRLVTVRKSLWIGSRCFLQFRSYLAEENALKFTLDQSNFALPMVFADKEPSMVRGQANFLKFELQDRVEILESKGTGANLQHQRLGTLKDEIFRSAYLINLGSAGTQGSVDRQSAESKAQDWAAAEDVLSAFGSVLKTNAKTILQRVAMASLDKSAPKFEVRGFRFEDKYAASIVALCDEVAALQIPSETLTKTLWKSVASANLEDYGADIVQKALQEIDAAPDPVQQQADAAEQQFSQTFNKLADRQEAKAELGTL